MRTGKFIIILSALLALCCCQEEEMTEPAIGDGTFTATIEEGTKTSLDEDGNVLWKKGNQVSIFVGSTINQQYQVTDASDGKTSAVLNPVSSAGSDEGDKIDNNVALYPYSSTAEAAKNEGSYAISKIVLPATQNYAAGSFGDGAFPMVAVTGSTSDQHLKFKNVLGCLKLQLKGTSSIASISVTGNNGEILCGAATVTASNGNIPSINLTDESAKTVALDCGTGVQLNSSTATPFVIALPPLTMAGGFTVVVTDTEGKKMEIKTTKSQTITRSSILKMPEVNYEGKEPEIPLTFTSTGKTTISLEKTGTPYVITLEYKLNDGTWTAYTIGTDIPLNDRDQVSFQAGDGGNSKFSKCQGDDFEDFYYFQISGTGKVAASGNIMSLADQDLNSLTIPYECYFYGLFHGCTSLTQAPVLPATTLASRCYAYMFAKCTSLTTAPELPVTYLASACYLGMFSGCTSLAQTPELPATTLAGNCYEKMFYGCTSLSTAPELPATTLAPSCYYYMFEGCTSLTVAPELPATSLALLCYTGMFSGCTSLTVAPELPATSLALLCYDGMFSGCTKLNYVKALFTTTPSVLFTYDWLSGVSPTGTFEKSSSAIWDVRGANGIPEGWTVLTSGKEYVDLGLSVKWATCNVGAAKPEEYGDYYAWGETETKSNYDWSTYKYCNGSEDTLTKYCADSEYGTVDNKTVLEPDDDVAHVKLGGNWRMPTDAEWTELRKNCTWTWTTVKGVKGRLVTSNKKGYTDKSIFLPAAGCRDTMELYSIGSYGDYWSSSHHPSRSNYAWDVYFYSDIVNRSIFYRCSGLSVRPVCE